jgi:protein-L-isoaspartate(D-aspartate) O-methyltransferase
MKHELLEKLSKKGFSKEIIRAFERSDREKYILERYRYVAYEDAALPIGCAQTISQPSTVAFMLELLDLKDNQKILEVGSGTGYVLSLISELSKNSEVFGVERIEELVNRSKEILNFQDKKIQVFNSSGDLGLKEFAPFDRIIVSASAKGFPTDLISQLKIGGIMVIPIDDFVFKITKSERGFLEEGFSDFLFVPLVE